MPADQLMAEVRQILANHLSKSAKKRFLQEIKTADFTKGSSFGHSGKPCSSDQLTPQTRGVITSAPNEIEEKDNEGDKSLPQNNLEVGGSGEIFKRKGEGSRAKCRIWLMERLSNGPCSLTVINEEAQGAGFSKKALRLARKELQIQPVAYLSLPIHQMPNPPS